MVSGGYFVTHSLWDRFPVETILFFSFFELQNYISYPTRILLSCKSNLIFFKVIKIQKKKKRKKKAQYVAYRPTGDRAVER